MIGKEDQKFWAKVDASSYGPAACWIWTGSKDVHGYGKLKRNGKIVRAHRYSLLIAGKDLKPGVHVCHRCDNPSCVNPAHLWTGSAKDNIQDCISKGRRAKYRGSKNHNTKLQFYHVKAIRASKEPPSTLATRYGVTEGYIRQIKAKTAWSWLT